MPMTRCHLRQRRQYRFVRWVPGIRRCCHAAQPTNCQYAEYLDLIVWEEADASGWTRNVCLPFPFGLRWRRGPASWPSSVTSWPTTEGAQLSVLRSHLHCLSTLHSPTVASMPW